MVCYQLALVPMSANVSFEAGATMPTVFITADVAFRHAVRVQPKQRVLVHAAAGEPAAELLRS